MYRVPIDVKEESKMQKRTVGTIVSAKKQWWLKVNTKAFRTGPLDGATFPYIAKIKYTIDGTEYVKNKWIGPGCPVPVVGEKVQLAYDEDKPARVKIVY